MVKENPLAPPGFFEAEAAGLRWLADGLAEARAEEPGGASAPGEASARLRVVRVAAVEPGRIELERIDEVRPTPEAARAMGRGLAGLHDAGAAAFGAAPDGWHGPLFIGKRQMPVASERAWGAFFVRDRVMPFLAPALAAGYLRDDEAVLVRRACDAIAGGAFDDDEPPARIHGDLWNGNVLWAADGPVLIDPAAHGGHRETDLAMLALFGCPYLDEVVAGYEAGHPLRPGWRERVPVHQLHPLAVHAAGHGRGYGVALAEAAEAVLQLVANRRE
ncbi:fructosamine kinase family protein [Agromyces sp. MMS24-K17]|uniref:fructosamine kinase family protein n=1 Tax=Agromyces sp. MMS24-K17 TaxID=3372850 RepID=UPI0037546A39